MMIKEGSTKIVNFVSWGVAIKVTYYIYIYFFFKNFLLYSQALNRQTKYIVMITKEGSGNIS